MASTRRALSSTCALAIALAIPTAARAATLTVGPGKTYAKPCAAIAAAQAGDVIEVDAAGSYAGDTCAWTTDNLTVRGVGGRAKIDATGVAVAETKGIFVIHAPNATVESFELSGASISQANGNNGAGIRHQGLNLTVRNCYFHDNQNGILGAPTTDGQGKVMIEGSEFAKNGAGDGFSHNMYLNHYAELTLRYSWSHGANIGHLVKTRALTSFILFNRITDETGGQASYEIDAPSAGTTYVIGNIVEQAATTQNPSLVSYGEEGGTLNADTHLFVVNNTMINTKGSGTFVTVGGTITTPAVIANNLFVGGGTVTNQAAAVLKTNFDASQAGDPKLANVASYDVHLMAGSPCIDKGSDPGANGSQSLAADHDYVHPLAGEARSVVGGVVDIGAYEFGNAPPPDAGGGSDGGTATGCDGGCGDGGASTTRPDSGSAADAGANGASPGGDSGCGCVVAGARGGGDEGTAIALSSLLGAIALVALRRKRAA